MAFFFILLFVVGCSNKNDTNKLGKKYESQIENQIKEIQELKEENEQLKTDLADYEKLKTDLAFYERQLADYRTDLQEGDRQFEGQS